MIRDMERAMQTYWTEKSESESERAAKGLIPSLNVKGELFDRIFGGNTIDIRPQGSAEIIFGVNVSKTENPRIPVDQRRITTFDFDQKIQLNLVGLRVMWLIRLRMKIHHGSQHSSYK